MREGLCAAVMRGTLDSEKNKNKKNPNSLEESSYE